MLVTADLDNIYVGVEALLENVDFLISSREFPQRLTGIAELTQSLPEIASRFGSRVAAATLGRDGVLAWDGSDFHYCAAFDVACVDTTGAGDIFHAAFAYGLLDGQSLDRILKFSCAAAALNCTATGARGGIRPLPEIAALVETGRCHPAIFPPAMLSDCSVRARATHQRQTGAR
jgi:sugar/nucleoside kinase (ribokinase family)